ncbi:hypothetical protein FVE85_9281 [Porphyridium purpureum]|uniref:F-box domain-containing protein n=1 Tax=Porphyridium purpureum TaxID=35688 RepID=A0A5J4YNK4_PORPP|nr:hypothetical protein FVE85_9281 [Porphyridium purpureum]|eukprot:POR0429..scf222_8
MRKKWAQSNGASGSGSGSGSGFSANGLQLPLWALRGAKAHSRTGSPRATKSWSSSPKTPGGARPSTSNAPLPPRDLWPYENRVIKLDRLPSDVLERVASFLERPRDRLNFALVSSTMFEAAWTFGAYKNSTTDDAWDALAARSGAEVSMNLFPKSFGHVTHARVSADGRHVALITKRRNSYSSLYETELLLWTTRSRQIFAMRVLGDVNGIELLPGRHSRSFVVFGALLSRSKNASAKHDLVCVTSFSVDLCADCTRLLPARRAQAPMCMHQSDETLWELAPPTIDPSGSTSSWTCVAIAPALDGTRLLAGMSDGTLVVYSLRDRSILRLVNAKALLPRNVMIDANTRERLELHGVAFADDLSRMSALFCSVEDASRGPRDVVVNLPVVAEEVASSEQRVESWSHPRYLRRGSSRCAAFSPDLSHVAVYVESKRDWQPSSDPRDIELACEVWKLAQGERVYRIAELVSSQSYPAINRLGCRFVRAKRDAPHGSTESESAALLFLRQINLTERSSKIEHSVYAVYTKSLPSGTTLARTCFQSVRGDASVHAFSCALSPDPAWAVLVSLPAAAASRSSDHRDLSWKVSVRALTQSAPPPHGSH